MANFLFYVMAGATVVAALGVVLARNPIASVLSLLASFFGLATIYLLAGFQFIAATQILVYAGAIMVLFLFVIMLLNVGDSKNLTPIDFSLLSTRRIATVLGVVATLFVVGLVAIAKQGQSFVAGTVPEKGFDDAERLAGALFGRYILPFEAVSLLLLATVVAVVVLAKRDRTVRNDPDRERVRARAAAAQALAAAEPTAREREAEEVHAP